MFEHRSADDTTLAATTNASRAEIERLGELVKEALALADELRLHDVGAALDSARLNVERRYSLLETDHPAVSAG